jgi:hypothetical protein
MTGRTCQLCGKPLSRFTVGSGGDFCSREHRNQFRLRLGMDRLLEANKVASLMRRRENAKTIPAAQLASDCKVLPRVSPHLRLPVRTVAFHSLRPSPAALESIGLSSTARKLLSPRAAVTPPWSAARRLESTNNFTGGQPRPLLRPGTRQFPVKLAAAGTVALRFAGSRTVQRRHEPANLGRSAARTRIGGNGIQLRALPLPASRRYAEPQPPRGLGNFAERGRELRVSGGVGFRLPGARLASFTFTAPSTTALAGTTRPRAMSVAARPQDAQVQNAVIELPVRGLFGPRPPSGSNVVTFRWPVAMAPNGRIPRRGAETARHCGIAWNPADPAFPPVRLTDGGAHLRPSADPAPIAATPKPWGIQSVHRLTLVTFQPPDTPFECSPTALHGSLVSGMQFGAPSARKPDSSSAPPLEEHFNAGLHRWLGGIEDWKLDAAGVRIGSLALFSPSLEMTDYQLEFLARIENRGVTWLFRMANFNDYFRATFAVAPGGGYEFRRSAVIGGVAEPPISKPVTMASSVRAARTAVTVSTRVAANEFSVSIEGQAIDTWTDSRLASGGIGFVGAPDDRARLYWVKVLPAGQLNKEYSKS